MFPHMLCSRKIFIKGRIEDGNSSGMVCRSSSLKLELKISYAVGVEVTTGHL